MAQIEKSFSEMVEELENHEDMVECKECFDLFPKADCMKIDHGYLCPVCGKGMNCTEYVPTSKDITIGLFDQDFPEYEGKPGREGCGAEGIKDVFDALIEDEVEAIEGYEKAEVELVRADLPNKDEVEETLEHIKEEEEEHIEELKALSVPEQPAPLKEDSSKSAYVAYDLGNHSEVIAACYADSAEEALKKLELPFIERTGKRGSEVKDLYIELAEEDMLSDLAPDLFVETLTEHVNEEHPAIESDQELSGTDNAVVDCKAAKVIAHSEDEKPVDCCGEKKSLEKPLTEGRVEAFNAAQKKANDLNREIAYGYSSSNDGSFKELELAILEPGYEEDMENIYDDFGVLYVAYPGKDLHESLERACVRLIEKHQTENLTEGSGLVGKVKDLFFKHQADKLFTDGYLVFTSNGAVPAEYKKIEAKTFAEAAEKAKIASASYPKATFGVSPKVVATWKDPVKNALDVKADDKYLSAIAVWENGKRLQTSKAVADMVSNAANVAKNFEKLQNITTTDKSDLTPEQEAPASEAPASEAPTKQVAKDTPTSEPEAPTSDPAEKPSRDMSKQSKARDNNLKILKALKNAGYDIADLRDGKKATNKLKQLRREIFGESLEEEVVECTWCEEKFPKSACRQEIDLGWLCSRCEQAITSRGGKLSFTEDLKDTADVETEPNNLTEAYGYDCPRLRMAEINKPGIAKYKILFYFRRNKDVCNEYRDCTYLTDFTGNAKFKGLPLVDSTRRGYGTIEDFKLSDDGEVVLITTAGKEITLRQALRIASRGTDKFGDTRKVLLALKAAAEEAEKTLNVKTVRNLRVRNALNALSPEIAEELKNAIVKIEFLIPGHGGYSADDLLDIDDSASEEQAERAAEKINKIHDDFYALNFVKRHVQEMEDTGMLRDRAPAEKVNWILTSWGAVGKIYFNRPIKALSKKAQEIIENAKLTSDPLDKSNKTVDCYRLATELIQYFDGDPWFYDDTPA